MNPANEGDEALYEGLTEGNNPQFYTYEEIFQKHGDLYTGKLLGSKSLYRAHHSKNKIYFNANIFTEQDGKIWWGDLDITVNQTHLQDISNELGKTIYILSEHDGRFGMENRPFEELKKCAVATFNPEIRND